jgi:hypothetical protein
MALRAVNISKYAPNTMLFRTMLLLIERNNASPEATHLCLSSFMASCRIASELVSSVLDSRLGSDRIMLHLYNKCNMKGETVTEGMEPPGKKFRDIRAESLAIISGSTVG